MEVKLAYELRFGDIIVHDHNTYIVNKYVQHCGMGHFRWEEYGTLYFNKINPIDIHNSEPFRREVIEKETNITTYKFYPFVWLDRK